MEKETMTFEESTTRLEEIVKPYLEEVFKGEGIIITITK